MYDIRRVTIPNVVLATESEEEFREVLAAIWNRYQPLDVLEAYAVVAYGCYNWRWRRLWEVESAAVNAALAEPTHIHYATTAHRVAGAFDRAHAASPFTAQIHIHESRLRRATREAERKLEKMLALRAQDGIVPELATPVTAAEIVIHKDESNLFALLPKSRKQQDEPLVRRSVGEGGKPPVQLEIVQNEPKPAGTPAQTPRNALCPCRSGLKYKRCCGRLAPPILGPMAA